MHVINPLQSANLLFIGANHSSFSTPNHWLIHIYDVFYNYYWCSKAVTKVYVYVLHRLILSMQLKKSYALLKILLKYTGPDCGKLQNYYFVIINSLKNYKWEIKTKLSRTNTKYRHANFLQFPSFIVYF